MKYELMLSGSGGQGLILAGIILAKAAVRSGYHVIQSQSYGPEARGGASRAEVIISDQPLDFPKVLTPDCLLALTEEAFVRYSGAIDAQGIIVVDDQLQIEGSKARILQFPIFSLARSVGREITANMVALGLIAGLIKYVNNDVLEETISGSVPGGTSEINITAFRSGFSLTR